MRRLRVVCVLAVLLVGANGCFHATVETGSPPSPETLEKSFAASWIYGLVPPSTIETAQRCRHGVARVETQLSFVNQLVGFLTFGIYTPMKVKVTCAAAQQMPMGAETMEAPQPGVGVDLRYQITEAAIRSLDARKPVWVRF